MGNKSSNCIGYALYRVGLQESDQLIAPRVLAVFEKKFGVRFKKVPLKEAQVIAALEVRGNRVLHMAVSDSDGLHVTHRPYFRADIVPHVPIEQAFTFYYQHPRYARIVGLQIERVKR